MPNVDNDAAVRDRAYFLWEQAGRPAGREHEFWAQASREIEGDQELVPTNPSRKKGET